MASSFQLWLNGTPADEELYSKISSLEVEENADLPGAIQINLPVTRTEDGNLTFVSDDRFRPLANLAVVAALEDQADQCIFDGYILAHKLHLETGITASNLQIWGQDASWLMNLEEKAREWVNVTDASAANTIFADYGIDAAPENTAEDSPTHTEAGHSLMQRSSDIQFLRQLARRNGKLCRVACASTPGKRIGYFASPRLDGEAAVTITLTDPDGATTSSLDFDWDATRPSAVKASQALFNDSSADGVSADTEDSGLPLLGDRSLINFTGQPMTAMLAAPVDDGGELQLRAKALLREAGWFVRCEGETEASRLNAILRVGMVVEIQGVGSLNSGKYYVWSARHSISANSHKMKFVLVRNAVSA